MIDYIQEKPRILTPPTDEEWEKLLDSDRLDKAEEEAYKRRKSLDEDDIRKLRLLCKSDTFFLAYSILGYKELTVRLHGNYCKWLRETLDWLYRITLLPRTHFKSTICTITDSISCSLPDDENKFDYPRNLGPDIRLLITHETLGGAQRFLFEITAHFTGNVKLLALFPELRPNPRKHRINKSELQLPRNSFWAEPTFDTMGVGGRSQGRHYDYIKMDDLFGDKARDSQIEAAATIQWFDNIQSFLINLVKGRIDLVGTRWKLGDVWEHAMKMYDNQMVKYIRRIEEINEDTGRAEPIFPERFPIERLEILRKNKKVWAAQYVNDPREGLAEFDPNWKRFYHQTDIHPVVFFSGEEQVRYRHSQLDRVILIDPAVSRCPGIVVTGMDDKERVFTLDVIKETMNPTEFVERLFILVQTWWPRTVAIEEVVFSEVYSHWIRREQKFRNVKFHITPYKPPRDKIKNDRIHGNLGPLFSSSMIYFHMSQKDIIWEFDNFGATDDIHCLDALAQGPDVWRPYKGDRFDQRKMQERMESRMASIDPMTGYSVM